MLHQATLRGSAQCAPYSKQDLKNLLCDHALQNAVCCVCQPVEVKKVCQLINTSPLRFISRSSAGACPAPSRTCCMLPCWRPCNNSGSKCPSVSNLVHIDIYAPSPRMPHLARPKSAIFTQPCSGPSPITSTLEGLRSRCMTAWQCR